MDHMEREGTLQLAGGEDAPTVVSEPVPAVRALSPLF